MLLLIWSVNVTVMISPIIQGQAFFPKFCNRNTNKKRYRGIQVLLSLNKGKILSKKEFVQS